MQLETVIKESFSQLQQVLSQLKHEEYTACPDILNGSSIGQHCRHLLEIYVCLNKGYDTGIINYDNRERNKAFEQSIAEAQACIDTIVANLNKPEKSMLLSASYSWEHTEMEEYNTSYKRELAYAFEHAVHHMALIGVGIKTVAPQIAIPVNFGVASSTIKYRKQATGS